MPTRAEYEELRRTFRLEVPARVLAEGHEAGDDLVAGLQEHVKATTAPYKYPRRIEFTDELAKMVSGKIRRVELRNR